MKEHNCTACLWEYMCDWDKKNCRYVPEKEVDGDERDIGQIHG